MNLQNFHRQTFAIFAICSIAIETLQGQEASVPEEAEVVSPLNEDGHLVQFARDIAPILQSRCIECHGAEDAKADFRVDDADSLMDYIEAEDVESSALFVDFLTSDDEDMLMPPKSHGGPLGPDELALIRVWIQEGAQWPEGFEMSSVTVSEQSEKEAPPQGQERCLSEFGVL